MSACLSVHPFVRPPLRSMIRKYVETIQMTWLTGTSREYLGRFVVVSLSILPRMRNISDRFVEEIKAHQKHFFENRAVYEKMSKNMV